MVLKNKKKINKKKNKFIFYKQKNQLLLYDSTKEKFDYIHLNQNHFLK